MLQIRLKSTILAVLLSISVVILGLAIHSYFLPPKVTAVSALVSTSESVLRKKLSFRVEPQCPAGQDPPTTLEVLVAEVVVGSDGSVRAVEMHEAPTPAYSREVENALLQWRFLPDSNRDGIAVKTRAKLTFYSVNKDGKCMIVDPTKAGVHRRL